MSWLVEVPDVDGNRCLVNFDAPLLVQPNGAQTVLTTATGQIALGLPYDALCGRLRLNPADRMPPTGGATRRRLGRLPAKRDPRVPTLAAVAPTLPAAPARCTDAVHAVPRWILGANDRVGDCTCVAPANVILALTTRAGRPERLSDEAILGLYASLTGYDPADPSTDAGALVEDVLTRWHAQGIDTGIPGAAPDRLDGFATVSLGDHDRVRRAIAHLGPIDLGVNLPVGWENAATWDTATAGDASAGGHCVAAVGYTETGPLVVSWGQVFPMTWDGWDAYVEEAHALLSRDAIASATGRDADGVDWASLEGFMAQLREAA